MCVCFSLSVQTHFSSGVFFFSLSLSLSVSHTTTTTTPFVLHTEAELLEMIERADTDQDGVLHAAPTVTSSTPRSVSPFFFVCAGEISADEFYTIMTKKTFSS